MVEVDQVVGSSTAVLATYRYDGEGRLIVTAQATTTAGTLDSFTYSFYAGVQVIETRASDSPIPNPQSLVPSFQYVWSARYVDSPILRDTCDGSGDPISAQRIYYLTDANHNVTALADASGNIVERYVYTPYGQATIYNSDWTPKTVQTSSVNNTIRFGGMSLDTVTGFYHSETRWYDPGRGIFFGRNPAFADVNLYRYVGNNPIGGTDPTGLYAASRPLPFDSVSVAPRAHTMAASLLPTCRQTTAFCGSLQGTV